MVKRTKTKNNEEEDYQPKTKKSSRKQTTKSTRKSTRVKTSDNKIDEDYNTSSSFSIDSPMLAGTYDGTQDITNWYMSEKLDGVRCIWNGKNLYSRYGNKFHPPKTFTENFPEDLILDGELFLERNNFRDTVSIVKKQYPHEEWNKLKYIVFDAPKIKGDFKTRLTFLKKIFAKITSDRIQLHPQEICSSKEELEKKLNEVIALKGEGIIIRDPNARYENRRTNTMLKVKRFQDGEAVVLRHLKGTGRLAHTMGAVEVKNKEGVVFKVGSGFTDKERAKPPKIGSVITYRYFELTKDNVPRFPTFMRVHAGL